MLKTRPIKCASARLHRHKNLRRFAMARPFLVAMRAWVIHRLLRLLSVLPLPINHALGTLVGLFMYVLPTRMRHVTEANLRRAIRRVIVTGEGVLRASASSRQANRWRGHRTYGTYQTRGLVRLLSASTVRD